MEEHEHEHVHIVEGEHAMAHLPPGELAEGSPLICIARDYALRNRSGEHVHTHVLRMRSNATINAMADPQPFSSHLNGSESSLSSSRLHTESCELLNRLWASQIRSRFLSLLYNWAVSADDTHGPIYKHPFDTVNDFKEFIQYVISILGSFLVLIMHYGADHRSSLRVT